MSIQDSKDDNYLKLTDIYQNFVYEWDLASDYIRWQNPARLLIGDLNVYNSGDRLSNRMPIADFEKRIELLTVHARDKSTYVAHYVLRLPDQQVCLIKEQGTLLFEGAQPVKFIGVVELDRSPEASKSSLKSLPLTAIEEDLKQVLIKGQTEPLNAAFLQIVIDKIPLLCIFYGPAAVKTIIQQVQAALAKSIRKTDLIGRISGNSFGVILHNCNQAEIIVVAKRLVEVIEGIEFKVGEHKVPVHVSIGGAIIQGNNNIVDPASIIESAAEAVLGMKNIRKISIPPAYLAHRVGNEDVKPGQRRKTDKKQKS